LGPGKSVGKGGERWEMYSRDRRRVWDCLDICVLDGHATCQQVIVVHGCCCQFQSLGTESSQHQVEWLEALVSTVGLLAQKLRVSSTWDRAMVIIGM